MSKNKSKRKNLIPFPTLKKLILELPENKDPFILDQAITILNQKKFIQSHFKIVESNPKKRFALPYYMRLYKYYQMRKNKIQAP